MHAAYLFWLEIEKRELSFERRSNCPVSQLDSPESRLNRISNEIRYDSK